MRALDESMLRDGFLTPMTAVADGEMIDGSLRLERVADVFDGVEPIIVESDGTRPIIHVRTDIPNAEDPRAKRLAVAANIVPHLDLDLDPDLTLALMEEDAVIQALIEQDQKLMQRISSEIVDDPMAEWKGMPEFNQDDLLGAQKITVHFPTLEDAKQFGVLIGQTVTDKTNSLWYPKRIDKEKYEIDSES